MNPKCSTNASEEGYEDFEWRHIILKMEMSANRGNQTVLGKWQILDLSLRKSGFV